MTTAPWLEYSGQSTDELLALEGKYRTDSLVVAFETALLGKEGKLTTEESYVLAIEALEREVNNGGYAQFFSNVSGEHAPIIEDALRAIGCPKTANMTRDAIAAVVLDGELDADALAAAVAREDEEMQQTLSECDEEYFANDEEIADRLFEWIKANRMSIQVT
jgi:hypothetical protein